MLTRHAPFQPGHRGGTSADNQTPPLLSLSYCHLPLKFAHHAQGLGLVAQQLLTLAHSQLAQRLLACWDLAVVMQQLLPVGRLLQEEQRVETQDQFACTLAVGAGLVWGVE